MAADPISLLRPDLSPAGGGLLGDGPTPDPDQPQPGGGLTDLFSRLAQWWRTQQVDPIWPTSNPTGTERFVDYRGYDRPVAAAAPDVQATRQVLAADPNVGEILPFRFDSQGVTGLAVPNALRETAR